MGFVSGLSATVFLTAAMSATGHQLSFVVAKQLTALYGESVGNDPTNYRSRPSAAVRASWTWVALPEIKNGPSDPLAAMGAQRIQQRGMVVSVYFVVRSFVAGRIDLSPTCDSHRVAISR
jgi:hypothetical protein